VVDGEVDVVDVAGVDDNGVDEDEMEDVDAADATLLLVALLAAARPANGSIEVEDLCCGGLDWGEVGTGDLSPSAAALCCFRAVVTTGAGAGDRTGVDAEHVTEFILVAFWVGAADEDEDISVGVAAVWAVVAVIAGGDPAVVLSASPTEGTPAPATLLTAPLASPFVSTFAGVDGLD